jgi:hypothetical protein
MSQVIELPDETYRRLEELAAEQGQSPVEVIETLITGAEAFGAGKYYYAGRHYYELDDWFRHLGMSEEEIAEADAQLAAEEAADADA